MYTFVTYFRHDRTINQEHFATWTLFSMTISIYLLDLLIFSGVAKYFFGKTVALPFILIFGLAFSFSYSYLNSGERNEKAVLYYMEKRADSKTMDAFTGLIFFCFSVLTFALLAFLTGKYHWLA